MVCAQTNQQIKERGQTGEKERGRGGIGERILVIREKKKGSKRYKVDKREKWYRN